MNEQLLKTSGADVYPLGNNTLHVRPRIKMYYSISKKRRSNTNRKSEKKIEQLNQTRHKF